MDEDLVVSLHAKVDALDEKITRTLELVDKVLGEVEPTINAIMKSPLGKMLIGKVK